MEIGYVENGNKFYDVPSLGRVGGRQARGGQATQRSRVERSSHLADVSLTLTLSETERRASFIDSCRRKRGVDRQDDLQNAGQRGLAGSGVRARDRAGGGITYTAVSGL